MANVLIIDDEPSQIARIKNIVRITGNYPVVAHSAKQGLGMYNKYHPDMVLTVSTLPDGDGLDIIRLIRGIDKDTPIIMLADYMSQNRNIMNAAMELGANQTLENTSAYQFVAKSILNNLKEPAK